MPCRNRLRELPYAAPGMTTAYRALASKAVAEITPGGKLSKVLFTLGGADANENAIKLARGYTGRHQDPDPLPFLSRRDGGRDGCHRRSRAGWPGSRT